MVVFLFVKQNIIIIEISTRLTKLLKYLRQSVKWKYFIQFQEHLTEQKYPLWLRHVHTENRTLWHA